MYMITYKAFSDMHVRNLVFELTTQRVALRCGDELTWSKCFVEIQLPHAPKLSNDPAKTGPVLSQILWTRINHLRHPSPDPLSVELL